ncbi:unnamed protein product [Rhizophagus irregularis]|nr:unnamed protein product [Rhizophagus irregularis]
MLIELIDIIQEVSRQFLQDGTSSSVCVCVKVEWVLWVDPAKKLLNGLAGCSWHNYEDVFKYWINYLTKVPST